MIEEWKDIPGYEGYYQVSNLGRVKSLEREVFHWRGGLRTYKEKYKKASICKKRGYAQCGLCKDGISKNWTIHVLVAMAFMSFKPKGHSLVVDHIDNNRMNNSLNNLQIITNRQNTSKDKKNKTGLIGVSKSYNKYKSFIGYKGKKIYLGLYQTAEEAHQVYISKLKELSK